jgi:hypothetical protein
MPEHRKEEEVVGEGWDMDLPKGDPTWLKFEDGTSHKLVFSDHVQCVRIFREDGDSFLRWRIACWLPDEREWKEWSTSKTNYETMLEFRHDLGPEFQTQVFMVKRKGSSIDTRYKILPVRQLKDDEEEAMKGEGEDPLPF